MTVQTNEVHRDRLDDFLRDALDASGYPDYGPNGLQVEGKDVIRRVAFSVSATRDSIEKAIEGRADALIVHHGLLWSFSGARPLTGAFGRRVLPLIRSHLNLFAYHLPLDAHLVHGNAAGLAREIGMQHLAPFGDYKGRSTGVRGELLVPLTAGELRQKIANVVAHPVLMASPDESALLKTLGIITGGANKDWAMAASSGLDAYLTGEMSEHDWHESQEAGIHMFAAGHHATEVFGVQSLMNLLVEKFGLECFYIDTENPA